MGLSKVLCEEHADEAAFLWTRRDRAALDFAYDEPGLGELDERIEAHVDGLRLAGEAGLSAAFEVLEAGEFGAAFVSMLLATERLDLRSMARVLDVAGEGSLAREVVSALAWAPRDVVMKVLPGLLSPRCPSSLHWIGFGACAAHRADPGVSLGYALVSGDERLAARACRTAGQLGRRDVLTEVEALMGPGGSDECRYWAAWSSALLGSVRAADALWGLAMAGGRYAERAAAVAARRGAVADGLSRVSWLAAAGRVREALSGAGALGEASLVSWMVDWMAVPAMARWAGLAWSMMTGVDLEGERLCTKAPEGFVSGPTDDAADDDVSVDADESLPWPDVGVVRGWWSREGHRFGRGARYLMGKGLEREALAGVLSTGRQPVREAAALEMVLGGQTRTLLDVRSGRRGV